MGKRVAALLTAAVLLMGLFGGCGSRQQEETPPQETAAPSVPAGAIDPLSEQAGHACIDITWETGEAADDRFSVFVLSTADNPQLPYSLACFIGEDGTVSGVLPAGLDLSAVVPTFLYEGGVTCAGEAVVSGETALDLRAPLALTLTDTGGGEHPVTLDVQTLYTGLPSVALTVSDFSTVTSKTDYVSCSLYVGGGDAAFCSYAQETPTLNAAQVRGRGNSSWSQDKKGYSVNLESAAGLLDMPAARKWALIANYEDKSLLRNYLSEYISEQAGVQAVLSIRPVDLWYNGSYWGTYNLCERVSIHEARVPITEQEDVSGLEPAEVAYLFEFDGHVSEVSDNQKRGWQAVGNACYYDPRTGDVFLKVLLGQKWLTVKNPGYGELTDAQAQYVRGLITDVCAALKKGDWESIQSYLDVTSFVRWYIVEEYMNNTDSSMHSSVFMYQDVGGKLTLGPTWDFDRSAGNCDYWNTENAPDSLYKSTAGWFNYLFQCEEARAILKTEWAAFYEKMGAIGGVVDEGAAMLAVSQQYNFEKWNILDKKVGANPDEVVRASTYEQQVTLLRGYLTDRLDKMDAFIRNLS